MHTKLWTDNCVDTGATYTRTQARPTLASAQLGSARLGSARLGSARLRQGVGRCIYIFSLNQNSDVPIAPETSPVLSTFRVRPADDV